MGKVIAWNIISVDGFFEGTQQWDLRLHEHIWGEDLRQLSLRFGDELGLIVFGRVTYEGMAAHWQNTDDESDIADYMNSAPKLVASRTLTEASWSNTEVTADIVGELSRRKQADDRPIYVFGSAVLTDSLLRAGVVDELLIGVAPVILGEGTALFKPAPSVRPLQLLEARAIDTGGVLLRYAVSAVEAANDADR
ncbi:dihydrofolate reductase family protein [Paramicrobacterium sp. CJ85]|uniref:dihydrofolate reductase family protein n=1 Tax=Paramicrobacterium sp. CJ85 TaxID=3445355 RepID=UPI003F60FC89